MSKSELLKALRGIEGWLRDEEAWQLHKAARSLARHEHAPKVVEIGSWKGRSTVALALGLPVGGAGRVFAIDPHTGSREHRVDANAVDTFAGFRANLKRAGVEDRVTPIRDSSLAARSLFEDATVPLLFVDGSHEYEDVSADIAAWQTALTDGAVVAFNDPAWPGVNRALRESTCRRGSPYREPKVADNTLFCRYRPHACWGWRDQVAASRLMAFLLVRGWVARHRRNVPPGTIPVLRSVLNRIVR